MKHSKELVKLAEMAQIICSHMKPEEKLGEFYEAYLDELYIYNHRNDRLRKRRERAALRDRDNRGVRNARHKRV
jgi:hypothetical protein